MIFINLQEIRDLCFEKSVILRNKIQVANWHKESEQLPLLKDVKEREVDRLFLLKIQQCYESSEEPPKQPSELESISRRNRSFKEIIQFMGTNGIYLHDFAIYEFLKMVTNGYNIVLLLLYFLFLLK